MNKAKKSVIIFGVISALVIAILLIASLQSEQPIPQNNNDTISFYYGITCPHCKKVESFMEENNVSSTLNIEKKEVYLNKDNADELIKIGKKCNLEKDYIGAVPLIYYNKKCYLGDEPSIKFLEQKLSEATETKI